MIATQIVEGPAISSYGVLEVKAVPTAFRRQAYMKFRTWWRSRQLEEAPSNLAIIGRYILTPTVFETLSANQAGAGGELQLTDGCALLLKQEKMYAYVYEGKRHDTGDKLGFLKATVEFALKREDLGEQFREYLKTLKL